MSGSAADGGTGPLPMFPLGSVLFPGLLLPLHVFEPRYRVLTRHCLDTHSEFGVVLIERGFEVGGGDTRFQVGTAARIAHARQFPDGRWMLLCIGTRRIRVTAWIGDDPYPQALVEDLPELPLRAGGREALVAAERAVRRALALASELDEAATPPGFQVDRDPVVAIGQLVAAAPLGPMDQQRLLEEDEPLERLRLLEELAAEAAMLLAHRLSAG